jgi:hypothetical protein
MRRHMLGNYWETSSPAWEVKDLETVVNKECELDLYC